MSRSTPPLTLYIELTPEQRQSLARRAGLDVRAVPFWSRADAVRCRVGGISVQVDRGVFVPSASVERILTVVADAVSTRSEPIVVDVGTGSGALALAFAAMRPDARVLGTEVSEPALRCARRNRARLRLRNVRLLKGSLLEPVSGRLRGCVATIAANLPYLPPRLTAGANDLFPKGAALGAGADGLDLVRQLVLAARQFLVPAGTLVLQLAPFQWRDFERELRTLGYSAELSDGGEADRPAVVRAEWRG